MSTTRYCPNCKQFLPLSRFPIKQKIPILRYRARCKKCYYHTKTKFKKRARRKATFNKVSIARILSHFAHYESHPVISPLILANNPSLLQAGFSPPAFPNGEYRSNPDHFILFHLIPHNLHNLACKLFREKYCPQSTAQSHYLPGDAQYSVYFHPDIYTPSQIKKELYETDHFLFQRAPHNPYKPQWRYRRARLMRKLSRMFFWLPCRICGQTKLTYHINFAPTLNSQPVHWLRYLYDTIFSYWDFYPLAYNFLPAFNRKYGWDSRCLSCLNLPPIEWLPHEIEQGFTSRQRVYYTLRDYKLMTRYLPPS